MYFHTLFYLHVFPKNINNVIRTTLPKLSEMTNHFKKIGSIAVFLNRSYSLKKRCYRLKWAIPALPCAAQQV